MTLSVDAPRTVHRHDPDPEKSQWTGHVAIGRGWDPDLPHFTPLGYESCRRRRITISLQRKHRINYVFQRKSKDYSPIVFLQGKSHERLHGNFWRHFGRPTTPYFSGPDQSFFRLKDIKTEKVVEGRTGNF